MPGRVPDHQLHVIDGRSVLIVDRFDRLGSSRIGHVSALTMLDRADGEAGSYGACDQAGASASCVEAANASGPCSAAAGSIHMTCQPWPSRSKKLREYMKP